MKHRKSTAERGYGYPHRLERQKYKAAVDAGLESCRRCRRRIPPGGYGPCPACGRNHHGWDLGHVSYDPPVYSGPEHQCCNRGAKKRRLVKRVQRVLRRTTREW